MQKLHLKSGFLAFYNTAWFLAAVIFCSYLLLPFVGYRAIGPVFLVSILVVASFGGGLGATLFAAVVSACAWDFLFIAPQFTFSISNFEDAMMLISFFAAATVGGILTTRIRAQEENLGKREAESRELYELVRWLAQAKTQTELFAILKLKIESYVPGCTAVVLVNEEGEPEIPNREKHLFADAEIAAVRLALRGRTTGWTTSEASDAKCLMMPVPGDAGVFGAVVLFPQNPKNELELEVENYVGTVISNVAMAVDRLRFAEAAADAKVLRTSEKMHQTLLNSISHEMRTPLTVIMGSASMLIERNSPPEFVGSVAMELASATDRLNRVIENLLDMSRISSGVLQPKLEWHDVNDLVRAAIDKLGMNLKRHEVRIEMPQSIPPVRVDFRLLEHALSNLVLNAALYSPAGGEISVAANVREGVLQLSVTDRGPGIPEASRARIFDKFFRIPGTKAGGTGLGLSIVKGIVEIHGGRVHVEPADPGSRFVIEIPTADAPRVEEETHAGPV